MKVLIIKTTSLGDVLHTLPALTDALRHLPDIRFDWVVEQPFAEIPRWHSAVRRVIAVKIRDWRKKWMTSLFSGELTACWRELLAESYDIVLDAQGLLKSALIARCAKGRRYGLNWRSAWEPYASIFYQQSVAVDPALHAITRVRLLFSQVLEYSIAESPVDYGIRYQHWVIPHNELPYIIFLHGTTWLTKHWPEHYWCELAQRMNALGFRVKLPWGNESEKARAERVQRAAPAVDILPKLNLRGIATAIAGAYAAVAVDTGLGHLAAAVGTPCVSLYGITDPSMIGTVGSQQIHLRSTRACDAKCNSRRCARGMDSGCYPACFADVSVDRVMTALQQIKRL